MAATLLIVGPAAGLSGCHAITTANGDGGQTVVSYDGYGGPTLLSADQRTITVAGFSYPCFGTLRPIARQTRTRVALWLKYVTPVRHGACNMSMAMEGPRKIRLTAPLGSRLLTDGNTGRRLHPFDVRHMLRPSLIPAGYRLRDITPFVTGPLAASPAPACRQDYASPQATLSITQAAGPAELPQTDGRVPARIRVRGYPGLANADGISWREGGYNVLIEAFPETGNGSARVFATAQFIAIADSAPRT